MERGANWNDFLIWRGILSCIPNIWKEFLTQNHENDHIQSIYGVLYNENVISIGKLCHKTVKNILRNSKFEQVEIKSKKKYNETHNLDKNKWKYVYILPHVILHDNKIIEMQFKILHRIIATNTLLYKIGKINSPTCQFCQMHFQSIEHVV